MKKQVLIKKTVLAWFNIYQEGQLIANLPLEKMKKLIPGFTGEADLSSYKIDLSKVKRLKGVSQ